MTVQPRYKRILLKVSGEALMGGEAHGIHLPTLRRICEDVAGAARLGVQIAIVVGGGNIFRGLQGATNGMTRADADQMGMLATVMNALALQDGLNGAGLSARAMSAIAMPTVCEPFTRARAARHLERGHIVVFGGGTGNPYFTTDTTAVLRAAEMQCDAVFKATQVDGIYSADPNKVADAKRYDTLSYNDALTRNLKVMDAAAIALARDNAIPIVVFSIRSPGCVAAVLQGEGRYTTVTP